MQGSVSMPESCRLRSVQKGAKKRGLGFCHPSPILLVTQLFTRVVPLFFEQLFPHFTVSMFYPLPKLHSSGFHVPLFHFFTRAFSCVEVSLFAQDEFSTSKHPALASEKTKW